MQLLQTSCFLLTCKNNDFYYTLTFLRINISYYKYHAEELYDNN